MSNNCLVTKLKSIIDNDAIRKIDEIKIHFPAGSENQRMGFTVLDDAPTWHARIVGDGNIVYNDTDMGKSADFPINGDITYFNVNAVSDIDLFLKLRYSSIGILVFTGNPDAKNAIFDINEFAYLAQRNLDYKYYSSPGRAVKGITGNIDNFRANASRIILFGTSVTGSLNKFLNNNKHLVEANFGDNNMEFVIENMDNYTELETLYLPINSIGNFADLAYAPKLNRLVYYSGVSAITGTIEDFVNIRKENGAGALSMYWPSAHFPNVTYQGVTLNLLPDSVIPRAGQTILNWDAQGNITWTTQ